MVGNPRSHVGLLSALAGVIPANVGTADTPTLAEVPHGFIQITTPEGTAQPESYQITTLPDDTYWADKQAAYDAQYKGKSPVGLPPRAEVRKRRNKNKIARASRKRNRR